MEENAIKTSTKIIAVTVPTLLILVGAGCFSLGEELASDVVKPVEVPVNAFQQAKGDLAEIDARANEEADRLADDLTIALILTENAEVPPGAVVGGTIGCNDRVAFVRMHREASTDSVLSDALTTLFSVRESSYDGYYNSLWQSSLAVDKIQSRDGVTTEIWLKGQTASGGVCDDPRIKAQIEETIKRIKPKYKIFLNGSESEYRCLGDMSGQCE